MGSGCSRATTARLVTAAAPKARRKSPAWLVATLLALFGVDASAATTSIPPGLWYNRDYGELLRVNQYEFELFEVTRISCISRGAEPLQQIDELVGRVIASAAPRSGAPHSLTVQRGISRYQWRAASRPPRACRAKAPRVDALRIFDIVWETFDRHYAFFDLKHVDWDAARRAQRPRLSARSDDEQLFRVLSDLLQPLHDRHVRLTAGARSFVSGGGSLREPQPDGLVPGYPAFHGALREYLSQGVLVDGPRSAGSGQLLWGLLASDIGYLAPLSLWDYTGSEPTDQRREVDAAQLAMDLALKELTQTRGLILDLRFNPGGSDAVALAIAARFATEERVAFTKQAVVDGRSTPAYGVAIEPDSARSRYTGAVVVLQGPYTASAAEVMILALQTLPQVTLLGRATMGVFSDTLYRRLPNGWEFTLSNEIYRSPGGALFEGSGVPPRVRSKAPALPSTRAERFGTELQQAAALLARKPDETARRRAD